LIYLFGDKQKKEHWFNCLKDETVYDLCVLNSSVQFNIENYLEFMKSKTLHKSIVIYIYRNDHKIQWGFLKDPSSDGADEEYKNHHGWMKHFNKNYFIDRDTEYLKNASLIKMFSQKTQRTIFISDRSSEFIESDDKFKICTTKYEFRELI
jgi:hypothetical protein